MSDAARAKAAIIKLPFCTGDGACAGELGPCGLHEHIGQALDAYAAEQTAELREESARLRGSLERVHRQMLNHGPLDPGDDCFVCEALLADPEGQRAGEEWRQDREAIKFLADRVGLWANLANLPPGVLAAVERARQVP